MSKRAKYILGISILVLGLLAVYWWTTSESQNVILVTVDNNLDLEKVKIEFGFYNSSPGNDFDLTKNGLDKVVFKNTSRPFETICGENDFYLTYDDRYYTVLRHFIPNDFYDGIPEPHKYHFDLKMKNDSIYLALKITGQDGEVREKKLMKIETSKENFWGSLIQTTNDK
ncbi:MAG: hypothetical protein ACK5JQ_04710 [Bacteroidota bacterium]|jgi:hypothetical protein